MRVRFFASPVQRAVVLAAVAAACYANSLNGSFHYDDFHSIVDNPSVQSLGNTANYFMDPSMFSGDAGKAMYRPLLLVSYMVNYWLHGYSVEGYHVVNIGLHVMCAILLWRVALAMGVHDNAAMVGALAFAVHPIGAEPVNYISSRSEVMATCLYLAAFLVHIRRADFATMPLAGVGLFILGLLSKSVVVTLPAVLLLYDVAVSSGRAPWRTRVITHLPYWIALVMYVGIISGIGLLEDSLANPVRGLKSQFFTQLKAIVYYLKLLVLPVDLNVEHQFFESDYLKEAAVVAGGAVVASLLFLAWYTWQVGERLTVFLFAWAWLVLLPSSAVPLNILVNERRLYLMLAIGAIMVARLCRSHRARLIFAAIPILALMTLMRNQVWADELTLWSDAVSKSPEMYRAQTNVGKALQNSGDWDAALDAYQRAIAIDDRYGDAYNNIAVIHQLRGDLDEATQWYLKAIERFPVRDEIYQNLGDAYTRKGRLEEAVEMYKKALKIDASRAATWNNYGQTLMSARRFDEAEAAFRKSLQLNTRLAEPYNNLANVYSRRGLHERAIEYYWNALQRAPADSAVVYANLADSYRALGKIGKARTAIGEALSVATYNPRIYLFQGRIERVGGNNPKAIDALERAIKLRPGYAPAMLELAEVLVLVGRSEKRAVHLLHQVLATDADNARALYLLGGVLEGAGDDEAARKIYNRFLHVWPTVDRKRDDITKRLRDLQ